MTDATIAGIVEQWSRQEVWRPIVDAPGYEVSSFGRVKRSATERILKACAASKYCYVSISISGQVATAKVHRLVAETFLGPPPFLGAMVAHNDGDRANNNVANLRWASALENQADRQRHNSRVFGSRVHGAKLTEQVIPEIRARALAGERYRNIADDFGISISAVSLIKLGRTWRGTTGAPS